MNAEDMPRNMGDAVRDGLGLVGQGVNSVARVLQSADGAVRQVDSALTGRRGPAPASEGDVTDRVFALVRQGRQEASETHPQAPGVVATFREALQNMNLVSADSDVLPSPGDAVRTGLRDLRGSLALVRLVGGRGSLADVEEVANFADNVIERMQKSPGPRSNPGHRAAVANPGPPAPTELPGCTAADETITVLGHLQGLSRGLEGFGVLRTSVGRLDKAAAGARRMRATSVATDLDAIKAQLPAVSTAEQAGALAEELQPVADRAWELGRRCGKSAHRRSRPAAPAEAS